MAESDWACALPTIDSWLEHAPSERAEYGPEGPYYDAMYGSEDDGWPFWKRFVAGAASAVEIGCGGGRLTEPLARWCPTVVGIDPNESAIAAARERPDAKARYKHGDASQLPLKDESVDRVLMPYGCMMYVLRPDKQARAFQEAARVLNVGGWLVVDVNYYPLGHPHSTGPTFYRHHSTHSLPDGSSFDVGGQADLDRDWNVCKYRQVIDHYRTDGTVARVATRHDQHLYTPLELYLLVVQAGLAPEHICGDFRGSRLTSSSRRIVLLARKPEHPRVPA